MGPLRRSLAAVHIIGLLLLSGLIHGELITGINNKLVL
jgi:hypothetical protein